ncbi:MAG: hypothetical protein IPM66_22080 [Acidobacteriota bacterium]|nr:MAG: hypothetical protein IPM66_22080 [Acidobacteriota bacterium]
MKVGRLSGNSSAWLPVVGLSSISVPLVSVGKSIALRPAVLRLVAFSAAQPTADTSSRLKAGSIIATASVPTVADGQKA